MEPDISPAEIATLGQIYSELGKQKELIDQRSKCLESIQEIIELREVENLK